MAVANHQEELDYYKTLGVKQEDLKNQSEDDIQYILGQAKRKLALKYHPDKGGKDKDFQDLMEAYNVLIDLKRRKAYDEMLKNRMSSNFFANTPTLTPNPLNADAGPSMYQALKPLSEIQNAFEKFIREKIGDANAKEFGFSAKLSFDPATGCQVLSLTFPNKEMGDEFINRMLKQGMIQNLPQPVAEKTQQEQSAHRWMPSAFRTGLPSLKRT